MQSGYPFRNLVFKGGGIKAFAYIGAIEVFEEYRFLTNVKRVAGNSAGSVMAALLSFRQSADETRRMFETLDYSKIAPFSDNKTAHAHSHGPKTLVGKHQEITGGIDSIGRLFHNFGLFSSEAILEWLLDTIASQCRGNGRATFSDFEDFGFRDLHVIASNISTHQAIEFSAVTTPHTVVADAVVASCSIPLFFEAKQFDGKAFGQGDYLVDGGVLTNYPIQIFDDLRYERNNALFINGVNWKTLGCRLYTPDDCNDERTPITDMKGYVENLLATLSTAEDASFDHRLVDQHRTINISNCCVDTTDFSIKAGGDNPKYAELLQAGRTAAREFLENYQSRANKSEEE